MARFKYKKIDAFTSGESLGNPAACLYLESGQTLSRSDMLNIAKQHKGFVSEVVFCSETPDSAYKLVYYSSECEVDFCGHGTVACMYSIIKTTPELLKQQSLLIETNKKGRLTIFNEIHKQNAVYITAPDPEYIGTDLTIKTLAEQLGLGIDNFSDTYPIDMINAGLRTLIVPILSLESEITMFPKEQKLKDFCLDNDIDIILVFSKAVQNNDAIAHTRVFAPKFGYLEDPATGSGNSAFGYYMLKNNMWGGTPVLIEQGGIDRLFNIVKLTTRNHAVLFGGSATTRIEGEYLL